MPGKPVTRTSSRRGPREPRRSAPPRLHGQLAGCILWLPRKSELGSGPDSDGFEEDRCNHPVVVLSPQVEDGKVVYLMITSLKGMGLETRFGHDSSLLRLEHIPIRPCDAHPDNGMLLSLEDVTLEMRKKSYVKTRTQYRIQLHSLIPYDHHGPDYLLSRKSYQELIEYAKFSPPPSHPASNTVTSPRRARSASYSEYVNALRGLEAGIGSPPRGDSHLHHASIPSVSQTRYSQPNVRRWEATQPNEREPLVAASSYGYSRHSYGSQPGSYPVGGHPGYAYRNASRVGYQGLEPPEPFDWEKFWKIFKVLFWIGVAMVGFYGAMRCVQWLGGVAKYAAGAVKDAAGVIYLLI
ncbi:hypothetical protein F4820DRAFT_418418 [Hypoxylon rubiginosum]|uniref:Uncharacterized protein n=1 Tax=Hypoxylon rubiginosum TaxID=110542 RepID=A0ACB9Z4V9_9PEZI|nr:hypothetical protein F4820DRAFT_418418 [Hypoxylon rubiginosum]